MAEAQRYTGGCHCQAVRYEVEADISTVMECNCSHCQIKGLLLTFAPAEKFKLVSGNDNLAEYQFNKHHIHHLFCKTCGVQSFARGAGPKGEPTVAINVRAIDGVDLAALERKPFNGRAM
jgi:hypothetical protein